MIAFPVRHIASTLGAILLAAGAVMPVAAQDRPTPMPDLGDDTSPITLTLSDAVRVALDQNFDLQRTRLDVRNADAQVREAWGQVMPQIDVTGGYTRNVVTANPFAGSDVTGLLLRG